jgi:ribA/ribD-fused uncharacterized protein
MKYSINWLKNEITKAIKPDYVFFWGHTQKIPGVADKYCFSQWWPANFVVEGVNYTTAEHWMMAKKALLFGDTEQYQNVLSTDSPAKAKKYGRAVKNFDDALWKKHAYDFVVEGNQNKFAQHHDLAKFLISTKDAVIVEASPFDKIWGIGTKAHEPDPAKWNGTNLLGFALMEVRDILNKK